MPHDTKKQARASVNSYLTRRSRLTSYRAETLVFLLSVVWTSTTPASAQSKNRAESRAKALLNEAIIQYSMLEFSTSLERLSEARGMTDDHQVLSRIELYSGLNQLILRKDNEAQLAFNRALTYDPTLRLSQERFKQEVIRVFDTVRARMKGYLVVTADRRESTVSIDGSSPVAAPYNSAFVIGEHEVSVSYKGHTITRKVIVALDKKTTVNTKFSEVFSRLTLVTNPPGSSVYIDQKFVGKTPLKQFEVVKGPHIVECRRRFYVTAKRRVILVASQKKALSIKLVATTQAPRRIWTWIAAGMSLAATATAIGLAAAVQDTRDEYANAVDPDEQRRLRTQVQRTSNASNAMFGLAGSLLGASALLFFFEPRWKERSNQERRHVPTVTSILPSASINSASLHVEAQF